MFDYTNVQHKFPLAVSFFFFNHRVISVNAWKRSLDLALKKIFGRFEDTWVSRRTGHG